MGRVSGGRLRTGEGEWKVRMEDDRYSVMVWAWTM